MSGSGFTDSGNGDYKARAGGLTLLYLASALDREELCTLLEEIEAAIFDPDAEPGVWGAHSSSEEEWEEDAGQEWDEDEDAGEDAGEVGDWEDEELPDIDLVADRGEIPASEAPPLPMLDDDPQVVTTEAGAELFHVGRVLEGWLRKSPKGPLKIGNEESGLALIGLVAAWASTVVHALSKTALTMEELERATGAVRPEVLAERVGTLEETGMVEAHEDAGGETRYVATTWLREAIAPLSAAARLERRWPKGDTAPPDALDVEAAFMLALPLLELPTDLSGCCRLGVQLPGDEPLMAGATVEVEAGRVVSTEVELDPDPQSWATGSPIGWLDAVVIDPATGKVSVGGEERLAEALVAELHRRLFGGPLPDLAAKYSQRRSD